MLFLKVCFLPFFKSLLSFQSVKRKLPKTPGGVFSFSFSFSFFVFRVFFIKKTTKNKKLPGVFGKLTFFL